MIKGLTRHSFVSTQGIPCDVIIAAKTSQQAWNKFVVQHFGALKPARSDWIVSPTVRNIHDDSTGISGIQQATSSNC